MARLASTRAAWRATIGNLNRTASGNVTEGVSRTFCALLLAGCASYRALPSAPAPAGLSRLPLEYETTRLIFFKSTDDAAIAQVFASPALVLATSVQAPAGVYASAEGEAWSFTPLDEPVQQVVFGDGFALARAGGRLLV